MLFKIVYTQVLNWIIIEKPVTYDIWHVNLR